MYMEKSQNIKSQNIIEFKLALGILCFYLFISKSHIIKMLANNFNIQ